jgi:hypothetical protein
MPTLQTTPYLPWAFPDASYAKHKGHTAYFSVPIPTQVFENGHSEVKSHFDNHDRAVALERIKNTKLKEQGFLGHRNTTERSQRYTLPASRSSCPNGKFEDPSYEFSQTAGGLRGGTGAITKDGRAYVIRRLKERIAELDAIDNTNYSNGPPPHTYVLPQFNELDTTLQILIDAVATAAISGSLAETVTKVQTALLKVAPEIDSNDLQRYAEIVRNLKRACMSLLDERGTAIAADKKRVVKVVQRGLDRIDDILVRIGNANGSPDLLRKLLLPLQNELFKQSTFEVAKPGAEATAEGVATRKANAEAKRQLKARITAEVAGFDAAQRANIRQRIESGEINGDDLAEELDVLPETIARIVG